ncbi:Ig-like domain repeat protein [Corynebacterium lactis]|uniref:Bacterial Ig domain-containing protein n=1 Tax=Corynebacterium lactis RW2-5 TaxID=1408189 RepID=A0A0K2H2W1_9CORY|nr:Ig-like domain repeat protein [Corynebacterium lactis]ALA68367.1 hypothetical protein CLAC_01225 [Corynebacterium lactis RW2-5]
MKNQRISRTSLVLASGLTLAVLLAPAAAADSASASHKDGSSTFTRTVSATSVKPGSEITYTQKFEDTGTQKIYEWKNNVDSCLEYVADSATVQKGSEGAAPLPTDKVQHSDGVTHITSNDSEGFWTYKKDQPYTFSLKYKVTEGCSTDKPLESGFWYKWSASTWFSTREYKPALFKGGPSVTVVDSGKVHTSLALTDIPESAIVNEPIILNAKLSIVEADGNEKTSLSERTVKFIATGTNKELCVAKSSADGSAACEWKPETTGQVSVIAKFDGSDNVLGSSSEAKTINVTVAPPKTPTELKAEPANANGRNQTTISGKAEPGTYIEAIGPGGTRCVAVTDEQGNFSCNLGYLPAVPGTISVTASRDNVRSDMAEVAVNSSTSIFDSFNSPGLPGWKFPESPSLPSPAVSPR